MSDLLSDPVFVAAKLGAMLASQFATELGFKPGNSWEPPIARSITKDLQSHSPDAVEKHWRKKLGLSQ